MADDIQKLQRLAPYVLGRPRRGVVGDSRYAKRLRTDLLSAAKDPQQRPVLVSGEPGLEKDNLAALIHFSSSSRRRLLVRLDASDLQGPSRRLLDDLGENNLLVSGVDQLNQDLQDQLLAMACGEVDSFHGRLLLTAERYLPPFSSALVQIRVPPLRVRRSDLGDWMRYMIRQHARSLGWSRAPELPNTVVQQLQNHAFANNLTELDSLVQRALRQVCLQPPDAHPEVLPEAAFWLDKHDQLSRFDLWRWKPWLRQLMRSRTLWNVLLYGLVSWVFLGVNVALWAGPQTRADNPVLILFWAWWWPLILLSYPLVGRLWCAICPFMVWGTISQKLTPWRKRIWPHGDLDRWASPAMAAGFGLILVWEEVWNLDNTAWLSSCLLLLITAGAVIGSTVFEKRFWCRYLCPVGGMNGLFAKLSILELRAQSGTCSGSCSSYACFKGGPAQGEGLETDGCPLGTHPAHLSDNRNCVLCMTCTQACPNRSVQLRLRPPAADLQREMQTPSGERGLILVLAGGICLHHWDRLLGWLPGAPSSLHEGPLLQRLSIAGLALALPALVGLWVERRWLYAALPLLWAVLLARHLPIGMAEAGTLLPDGWPQWQADPHVIGFCQTIAMIVGLGTALVMLRRLLVPNRRTMLVGSMVLLLLGLGGRWLVHI